jgi:tRNA (mo5U34)-methyltransferase
MGSFRSNPSAGAQTGADRVLATDSYSWTGEGWGTKEAFEFARRTLRSKVDDLTIDVTDISPATVGTFDVVLFLGVLYHLRDPFGALQNLANVTRELLIIDTATDLLHLRRPAMAFYPGRELNSDPTNWWAPNLSCAEEMLRASGFRIVECVYRHSLLRQVAFALREATAQRSGLLTTLSQGRAVFHAWK